MQLHFPTRTVEIELVVFDKDGTLVDVHAVWGRWAEAVAAALGGLIPPERLLPRLGWDRAAGRIAPETPLAVATAQALEAATATWIYETGCGWSEATARARAAIAQAEVLPAPPLAPLMPLFAALVARGLKLAVVTSDDRAGVERDLGPRGALPYLSAIVDTDSGLAPKPAPDMLLAAGEISRVAPARALVVGDSVADLQMARAGGAALAIGVRSGAGTEAILAPHADLILDTVAGLLQLI
jgi:phosphoglycolate phosphatase-like HAD superfamily hydrolase